MAQDRRRWKHHAETFAQLRDTTAAPDDVDEILISHSHSINSSGLIKVLSLHFIPWHTYSIKHYILLWLRFRNFQLCIYLNFYQFI